jgi:putative transposase
MRIEWRFLSSFRERVVVPFFLLLLQPLLHFGFVLLDRVFRRCTTPAMDSLLLATLTDLPRSNAELVAENALLRQQLAILQRQVKPPSFKRSDRFWLLVWASRVAHWKQALVIIQPDTVLRWHREGFRLFWKHASTPKTKPKISRETIALIKQMAQENRLWGAERIQGELLKLGRDVAKGTVQRYMRGVRAPREPNQNWSAFVKTHVKDVWACDFLPVVDLWFRTVFVFFIMELEPRRVVYFGVTRKPTEAWVVQQLREATPNGVRPKYLLRDHDSKFGSQFDQVAKATRIEVLKIPYRAPRANAICERCLGGVRRECLDHLS